MGEKDDEELEELDSDLTHKSGGVGTVLPNGTATGMAAMVFNKDPPYTIVEDRHGVQEVEGVFGELGKELTSRLKLTYIVQTPKSGGFGTVLPNGTATGMAAMIFNKESDMILGSYALSYERFKVVEYLPAIITQTMTLLSRSKESKATVDFTDAITKVRWEIWMCILITIGISCLLYVIDDQFGKRRRRNNNEGFININNSYLWEFICIFIDQGSPHFQTSSTTIPKRILFVSFTLTMFLFNVYFGGNLSTEAVLDTRREIDSIHDLLEQSATCLLMSKGTLTEILIMSGKGDVYAQIHERLRSCPVSSVLSKDLHSESSYKMILSGEYALLQSRDFLWMTGTDMCNKHPEAKVHLATEPMFVYQASIAVGKNMKLALKKSITEIIERMISGGLISKWMSDEQGHIPACFQPYTFDAEGELTLGNLKSLKRMFYLWLGGICVAFIIFHIEVLIHWIKGKKKSSNLISP